MRRFNCGDLRVNQELHPGSLKLKRHVGIGNITGL